MQLLTNKLSVSLMLAMSLLAGAAQAGTPQEIPAKPALSGTTLNGKPFVLDTSKHDVVLVTFWATWCPTCRAEMPTFRKFYESHRSKGFDLVTVSIDDNMSDVDDYSKLSNWMTKANQQFPSLWRNASDYKDNFGKVWATPTAYLIGRDGKVIETFKGAIKPAQWARIRKAIATTSAAPAAVHHS
ncbi:MAG: TlpA family protein disulfide reductase [Burkholderiales bacterium]|nr:TlpA family protein disulfide reductase [Burkholderiales bacterium]